ncbi:hypothetical protein GJ699_10180 [Duganella sp. FT80W]|uniref:Uncharacterized protein n=1 Tax=Duganella guangzhouensis TaxID=2666084 RepID=A0A6I2KX72_9BURK|nr:hypothetical protein [Duganella guangzhouensis]MRW90353.1 hypothetical protein [Duganella guangzhouensis]
MHAFVAQHPIAKKYVVDKFQKVSLEPVVRVLALPPPQRAVAMARHMQN